MTSIHESDRAKEIALANTILRTQVGSGLHGVTVGGHDDRDEMGICIEPPDCVIGLEIFEQYQFRTQPEGVRSGPGDMDLVIYSLRKWARLAAAGNPTVLLVLFAPESEIVAIAPPGDDLRAHPELFLSRNCGRRFVGYLEAQRDRMLGLRSPGKIRREFIASQGFDGKYAYHAVRLGLQGLELVTTGRITLPMPEPDRSWLRELRQGSYSKDDALQRINGLRDQLVQATETADLPDRANHSVLNDWLTRTYQQWWADRR